VSPGVLTIVAETLRFCLAIWVGGTVLVSVAAPVVFRQVPSRDAAGAIFGEILRRFEAIKQVLSLLIVIAIFLQLEATGRLSGAAVPAGIGCFVAVATNVYLSMVVRPRMEYCRRKVGSFDAADDDNVWKRRFDVLHRRSVRVLLLGGIAAAVGLAFTP
jgi:hypothetical protein